MPLQFATSAGIIGPVPLFTLRSSLGLLRLAGTANDPLALSLACYVSRVSKKGGPKRAAEAWQRLPD